MEQAAHSKRCRAWGPESVVLVMVGGDIDLYSHLGWNVHGGDLETVLGMHRGQCGWPPGAISQRCPCQRGDRRVVATQQHPAAPSLGDEQVRWERVSMKAVIPGCVAHG